MLAHTLVVGDGVGVGDGEDVSRFLLEEMQLEEGAMKHRNSYFYIIYAIHLFEPASKLGIISSHSFFLHPTYTT